MNNKDRLNMLKMIYGPNVICTNGLFHIIDDLHQEIYIINYNNELDRRTKYRTIEVTDKSILAFDLSKVNQKSLGERLVNGVEDIGDMENIANSTILLLDKNTLEYKYKTDNKIKHIKNDIFIVCDDIKCNSEIIDNNGKTKLKLDNCKSITRLGNNFYICQSIQMFSDKLIIIDDKCRVVDTTKDKRYRIKHIESGKILIELMSGGEYIVDLRTKKSLNIFTNKVENNTNLFSIVL